MAGKKNKIKVKKATGVYFRESNSKRHRGKPDKCFYITYRNSAEKFVWEKIGWTSEGYSVAYASNIRAERVRAIRHGEELPSKRKKEITFGEAWTEFDKWIETNTSRPANDRSRYKVHLKDRFEDKLLSDITPLELEKLKSAIIKEGKAPETVKHALALVRRIFNKAKAWDFYKGENPVSSVKLPQVNNRRERFLSREESQLLLIELEKVSYNFRNIAFLSLYTGLRAGEIFNLKWNHIDLENDLILLADSKSGRSRTAYMTKGVKNMFKSLKNGEPEEFVFTDRNDNQVKEVSNTFSRVVKKLGFNEGISDRRQRVCFHTLRHTFASWLAIQGTSILTIKELLGHQSLAMTERYSHLSPDVKREAVEKLNK